MKSLTLKDRLTLKSIKYAEKLKRIFEAAYAPRASNGSHSNLRRTANLSPLGARGGHDESGSSYRPRRLTSRRNTTPHKTPRNIDPLSQMLGVGRAYHRAPTKNKYNAVRIPMPMSLRLCLSYGNFMPDQTGFVVTQVDIYGSALSRSSTVGNHCIFGGCRVAE